LKEGQTGAEVVVEDAAGAESEDLEAGTVEFPSAPESDDVLNLTQFERTAGKADTFV